MMMMMMTLLQHVLLISYSSWLVAEAFTAVVPTTRTTTTTIPSLTRTTTTTITTTTTTTRTTTTTTSLGLGYHSSPQRPLLSQMSLLRQGQPTLRRTFFTSSSSRMDDSSCLVLYGKKKSRSSGGGGGNRNAPLSNEAARERIRKPKDDVLEVEGVVLESLPNAMFRCIIDGAPDSQEPVLATISGKIRKNYVKILVGDKVLIELSPYDLTRGRITFRYR